MKTPGQFIIESMLALGEATNARSLGEDDDNDPRFKGKYVIILHQAMKTKIGYTMKNPQGGSGGSSANSRDAAIAAALRLNDDALRYIADHQHGEVEVYWSDWDEATDKTTYKLLKKVKASAPKSEVRGRASSNVLAESDNFNKDVDRLSPGIVNFPQTPTGTGTVKVLNITKEQADTLFQELKKLYPRVKMSPARSRPNSWLFKEF